MLAMIPVIMASMAFVFKLIMGDAGESGGAHSGAAAVASEAVLHVKTVRAARAEADVLARFAKITDAVAAEKVGAAWKGGVAYGLGMAIIFTLYLVVFAFGPVCVDEGWCSPTDMWKALFCIMFGAFGAGSSAIFAQDANKAKIAAFDVFAVLDRESAVDATADSGGARELKGLDLVFDAVSFAYPARREALVLDGLCLRVPASSTCAFVGPSGSGKSTIIQLVQRFYEPSSGSVTLGGAALASYDVAYLRSILGFVGQEPVLFDASLADNVRYGAPDATRSPRSRRWRSSTSCSTGASRGPTASGPAAAGSRAARSSASPSRARSSATRSSCSSTRRRRRSTRGPRSSSRRRSSRRARAARRSSSPTACRRSRTRTRSSSWSTAPAPRAARTRPSSRSAASTTRSRTARAPEAFNKMSYLKFN